MHSKTLSYPVPPSMHCSEDGATFLRQPQIKSSEFYTVFMQRIINYWIK